MQRRLTSLAAVIAAVILTASAAAPLAATVKGEPEKRAKIHANTQEALAELKKENPKSKELYDKAYGYAVFSSAKVAVGLAGAGGVGEAVTKEGRHTYMRMGSAGLSLGLGAQHYKTVFLFEDSNSFKKFVEHGWQAEGGANAVAGTAGANADPSFRQGMAVYTLTDGGLMLSADLSGTKYWKDDDL
jgi:lipid-binding SYLF domain-containing protein